MPVWKSLAFFAAVLLGFGIAAYGDQANLLPNPSFEAGGDMPDGWVLSAPKAGTWTAGGRESARCVSVTGTGEDGTWWRPGSEVALRPGAVYHISLWVRRASDSGGCAITGLDQVSRDFTPDNGWAQREFSFRTPGEEPREAAGVIPARRHRASTRDEEEEKKEKPEAFFRLGQWHAKGAIQFDDVTLEPAIPVYVDVDGLEGPLGAGESLAAGRYTVRHELGGPGANDHRALVRFTAAFDSNRWRFGADSEVVYRHELGGLRLEQPQLSINVSRAEKGRLAIEASVDGARWVHVGEVARVGHADFPMNLPSSREIWIRLASDGDSDIQVDDYMFSCAAPGTAAMSVVGATRYFVVSHLTPGLNVTVPGLRYRPSGEKQLRVRLESDEARREVGIDLSVAREAKVVSRAEATASLRPGRAKEVTLSYPVQESGPHTLQLIVRDASSAITLWRATSSFAEPMGNGLAADERR